VKFGLNGLVILSFSLILLAVLLNPVEAQALTTIDFDGFALGQIIDTEISGILVSAENFNRNLNPDIAIIYDSNMKTGNDPDLTGPGCPVNPPDCDGDWDGGNLFASQPDLEKMLILAMDDIGEDDGFVDDPDDEGDRPAGFINFEFLNGVEICKWGFDLADVEGPAESDDGFVATFMMNGAMVAQVGFNDFLPGGSHEVTSPGPVVFGNNYANRIPPFVIGGMVDEVKIELGGSTALDNIKFEECEVVGGHGAPIDKTALMVTGGQLTASWMIPLLVSAAGIGLFVVTRKS